MKRKEKKRIIKLKKFFGEAKLEPGWRHGHRRRGGRKDWLKKEQLNSCHWPGELLLLLLRLGLGLNLYGVAAAAVVLVLLELSSAIEPTSIPEWERERYDRVYRTTVNQRVALWATSKLLIWSDDPPPETTKKRAVRPTVAAFPGLASPVPPYDSSNRFCCLRSLLPAFATSS